MMTAVRAAIATAATTIVPRDARQWFRAKICAFPFDSISPPCRATIDAPSETRRGPPGGLRRTYQHLAALAIMSPCADGPYWPFSGCRWELSERCAEVVVRLRDVHHAGRVLRPDLVP